VLLDADLDPALIRARKVAVLGYGNQGRAQALNLRESGVAVIVGAREGPGAERARADAFDVKPPGEAAAAADLVALLAPDETHGRIYREALAANLRPGTALVFAHGLSIRFALIEPRPDLDILLVSPKGPGNGAAQRI
jgi:ketol-acid reductoisomerase